MLLVVLGVAVFLHRKAEEKHVSEKLEEGRQYLSQKDYEKATETYIAILSMDERNEEAQKGAVAVYMDWGKELVEDGEYEQASHVLEKGYEKTEDKDIGELIDMMKTEGIWVDSANEGTAGMPINIDKISKGGFPELERQALSLMDQVGEALDNLLSMMH